MASDYVPMDHSLPDKPEVLAIIEATGESVEVVFFRLFKLWKLTDGQTLDGVLTSCGPRALASRCGGTAEFWTAVEQVTKTPENPDGWLIFRDGCAIVPRFAERFRTCAKARRNQARTRKAEWKRRQKEAAERNGNAVGTQTERERNAVGTTNQNQNQNQNQEPRTKKLAAQARARSADAEFTIWYNIYPRHIARKAAQAAYATTLKRIGGDPAATVKRLLDAATAFAASDIGHGEKQFIPHPATWLNQARYDDDPETWKRIGASKHGRPPMPVGAGQKFREPGYGQPGDFS